MDSYDLFGEDGTGMLEGLADLGSDNFHDSTTSVSAVAGAPRDAPNQTGFAGGTYSQSSGEENPGGKMSGGNFVGGEGPWGDAGSGAGAATRGFRTQPPTPQQYPPQYHTGHTAPDNNIYSMSPQHHHRGMSDAGWAENSNNGVRGYPPPGAGYRHPHPYEHQKMHQYPQQQMGIQGGYIQRQPHYPPQQHLYPQHQHATHQQAYQGYTPMHQTPRMTQHMGYHQMDMGGHQYSHMHQGSVPPQAQPHTAQTHMGSHVNQMQPHPTVHPTHPHQNLAPSHPSQAPVHHSQNVPSHISSNIQVGVNHPSQLQNVPPHPGQPGIQPHSNQGHSMPPMQSAQNIQHPPAASLSALQNQSLQGLQGPNSHQPINNSTHPSVGLQGPHQNVNTHGQLQNIPSQTMTNVHPSQSHANASPHTGGQMLHMGPYSQSNSGLSGPLQNISYNPHPIQRSLDVNVNQGNQYSSAKTLSNLDTSSPQYRAPYPQLSPQISPRAQMSPRSVASQMSPRPVMSPAKSTNMSPHPHMQNNSSPRPPISTSIASSPLPTYPQQSTLQALEQMVLPTSANSNSDYPNYQVVRNPVSPVVGPRMPASPQPWQSNPIPKPSMVTTNESINQSNLLMSNQMNMPPATEISGTERDTAPNKTDYELTASEKTIDDANHDSDKNMSNDININCTVPSSAPEAMNADSKKIPESTVEDSTNETKPNSDMEFENKTTPMNSVKENENQLNQVLSETLENSNATANEKSFDSSSKLPLAAETISGTPTHPTQNSSPIHKIANTNLPVDVNQMTTNTISVLKQHEMPQQVNVPSSTISTSSNLSQKMPHTMSSNVVPPHLPMGNIPPTGVHSIPSQIGLSQSQLTPNIPSGLVMHPSMQTHLGLSPNMAPLGISSQGQYDPTALMGNMGLGPRGTNVPIGPMSTPGMPLINPGMMSHPIVPNIYHNPLNHHQERAAIQQQIQEIFCLPPSSENQENVRRLQEKLSILQQHETNDKCSGGPQCLLQNPIYGATMIDSPQVSSTTGRGRGKGPAKPRKPRTKKAEKLAAQIITQTPENLPVSEDCVTAGTGLKSISDINDTNDSVSENTIIGCEVDSLEVKVKKPRKPREKKIKDPKSEKEPGSPKESLVKKERKKREPKDPNTPRKRRTRKKEPDLEGDIIKIPNSSEAQSIGTDNVTTSQNTSVEPSNTTDASMDDQVTDFDDIPVSKIPIKELLEEAAAAKKERDDSAYDLDDDYSSTPVKRRSGASRRIKSATGVPLKRGPKRSIGSKRRRRGGIVPESDGEPDDLITTPPPSPPAEGDCDSSKRRSARHTQRKKYTDDVMMRLSDDEFSIVSPTKLDKETKPVETHDSSTTPIKEPNVVDKGDVNKPNYVYINTTDEDSMVVQFVLASRMGKREYIPKPPEAIKTEVKDEVKKEEVSDIKEIDEANVNKNEIISDNDKEDIKNQNDEKAVDESTENSEIKSNIAVEDATCKEEIVPERSEIKVEEQTKEGIEKVINSNEEEEKHVDQIIVKDDILNKIDNSENKDDSINETETISKNTTDTTHDIESPSESNKPLDDPEITVKKDPEIACKVESKSDTIDSQENKEVKNDGSSPVCKSEPVTKIEGTEEKPTPIMIDIEEFFVKYRNFSHLHCEWKTEDELYKGDKRISSKIKRFKQKQAQQLNIFECLDEEPFNPDYVEADRILDVSEHVDPATSEKVKHYLVKWKSLQYEDSTWELEEDIDPTKIQAFEVFREIPPKDKWKFKRRPSPDQWEQLKESPLFKAGNTLRPYQLEGLNWLLFSWHNGRNCILADEMGLGKTIQSLTFINAVWEYGVRGPFLVIAPLSTIPNWQREFEGWTDMNVIVYHGSQQSKSMLQEYELFYKNEKGEFIKEITKFNVLITTFEVIVTDVQELSIFNWRLCVIDEAHRLKNRNCKLLEGLRQLHLEHRVLLSGTPLQNNVNELFSLLNFLEPSQFSSSEAFLTEFGQLKSENEVSKLQALLKPMMLRRLKEDVEKSLAPKEETVVEVELTNIQKKYYRGILERNFSFLSKGTGSAANIPNLMNTMMELRKCCIHPYLLNGAEEQIQLDYKQHHGEDAQAYYKALIQSSGKMVLVDKLLPKLKANGHRVLIFSQMVRCLDILEDYLLFRKYPFERIDGRIRGNLRQEAIDRFSKPDSDRFVFLLCTKAGGLGINLTAADTVIIYDSDWNPQNDLQAQARCHRIGQQKMVKIYRLLCRNTYEREMFDKASMKLGLDKAILQSMNTSQSGKDGNSKQLSKKEIEDLLKKGAYGAVMDEDNAGDKFCEEDIDMILARRTQVIQMESEKGSTFSKASFSSSGIRSDIDIDDPDFWKKWAKKAEIDTEPKVEEVLVISEPRRRTQIKRYGQDDGTLEMSEVDSTPEMSDEEMEGIGLRNKKKKEKFGKRGRRCNDEYVPRFGELSTGDEVVVYGNWARSECFKVERGLLTFGWARWEDILSKNQFRKGWTTSDVEDCARIIVLFCLRHYKGDEKIRNFIWDLIQPAENGEVTISHNHSGLHNPVPRGRNAKKKPNKVKDGKETKSVQSPQKWEDPVHWSYNEKYDCETYLECSYKKHLFRHANKVLLRIRLMYYIKHEVIGEHAQQIADGVNASVLEMRVPRAENLAPRPWWDTWCDVSLLVGTYKHGYENYLFMRTDPQLVFLQKLGPPDDAECTTIKNEDLYKSILEQEEGGQDTPLSSPPASPSGGDESTQGSGGGGGGPSTSSQWPSMQDLNSRLRRLITSYQRNYKKEELRMQQKARKLERREKMDYILKERDREETMWRWTKFEEDAFCRTVGSYGVEFDQTTKSLKWGRFKALARLDKTDDVLTDYLKAFMVMCKKQCGLNVNEEELPMHDIVAEPIGEERAITTLERIDLLRVLREEIVNHPLLDHRLNLCENNEDTPPWWVSGTHDKLLILGICKHGLGDSYHKLFCDPKLPFADAARKWAETRHRYERKKSVSPDRHEDEYESNDDKPTRRRSKRHSHYADRREDDVGTLSVLSELESMAKSMPGEAECKTDSSSPTVHWFKDATLEARLHHIASAVQNNEWPLSNNSNNDMLLPSASSAHKDIRGESPAPPHAKRKKTHIAIDVETERAKLHALLSTPSPQRQDPSPVPQSVPQLMKMGASHVGWDKEDSSDSSRRSTPAPPPAHQRPSPAPVPIPLPLPSHTHLVTPSPVDLSAPLDLSEVQDFSMTKKTSMPSPSISAVKSSLTIKPAAHTTLPSTKGKLDDTLSKLMKRKNVPEPEVIVGREKKRKKLDEIVLGLSAAKGQPSSGIAGLGTSKSQTNKNTDEKMDTEISKISKQVSSNSSLLESLKSNQTSSSLLELCKKTPIPASVTLTPAAPPSTSPSQSSSQKPFSITVTSIPSMPQIQPKDLSAFLTQSLEQQNSLTKQNKPSTSSMSNLSQKKSYESMLADINKVADLSSKVNPYSHEAKVNKWLAEQTSAEALADYMAQRRHRRSDTSLDLKRLTGEEYVPVVHRLSGKRLSGPKAPQLKHLTQWIAENPMYDIDPKWTESVKETVKLTQDNRSARSSTVTSGNFPERKKGRPPISDSSAANAAASSMAALTGLSSSALAGLNSSLLSSLSGLSGFDPKTLASTLSSLANFDPKSLSGFDPKSLSSFDPKNLTGFDPKSLSSFDAKSLGFDPKALGFDPKALGHFDPKLLASLGGFDPKNPLLMPFSGVPNMLNNMNTSNMFANLAGMGLPNFSGLDMSALGVTTSGAESMSTASTSKSKPRKSGESGHNSKNSSGASSQFPFLFPNPNLLYPPLGLSGLNPFGVQSGMSSAYDALAHCGFINGLGVSSASTTNHSNTSQSTSRISSSSHHATSRPPSVSSTTTATSSRHSKSNFDRQAQLQHLLLPHDTYLLESLSKGSSYEALLKASEKRARESDRKEGGDFTKSDKGKSNESLRNKLPPEFAAVQEQLLKSTRGDKKEADISKILFEQMASGALSASLVSSVSSKKKETVETKDNYDKTNKPSNDFATRTFLEQNNVALSLTKPRENILEAENLVVDSNRDKKATISSPEADKSNIQSTSQVQVQSQPTQNPNTNDMDLEDLIAPSTVIRGGGMFVEEEKPPPPQTPISLVVSPHKSVNQEAEENQNEMIENCEEKKDDDDSKPVSSEEVQSETSTQDPSETGSKKVSSGRKARGKRQRDEIVEIPVEGKRELRSSAGRQAAAAAARQAAAARLSQQNNPTSSS